MAVVRFGPMVAGIRGTVGGVTFSGTKRVNYAKGWARPPVNFSPGVQMQRGRLVEASVAWAGLSPSEVNDWNGFAADPNEIDYDAFGEQRFLSGFQWYVRAHERRAAVGLGAPIGIPTGSGETGVSGCVLTLGGGPFGTCSIAWDTSQFPSGTGAVGVMAVSPRVGGVENWGRYAQVLAESAPGDLGEDITALTEAAFGYLVVGWRGWIRVFKQAEAGNRSLAALATVLVT